MELGRQVRVAGGGGRQLVEHVVVTLRLGLVSDPRLLQEVILSEINFNKKNSDLNTEWTLDLQPSLVHHSLVKAPSKLS